MNTLNHLKKQSIDISAYILKQLKARVLKKNVNDILNVVVQLI